MINNPIYIQSVLEKLQKITLSDLDNAIQEVEKELQGVNYKYKETYNVECNRGNYYIDTDYYDFNLHINWTRKENKHERRMEAEAA